MSLWGLFYFIFLSEQKSKICWRIQYIRFLKEQCEFVDQMTYLCALNINLMGHQVSFNTSATNLNFIPLSYWCYGHRYKNFRNPNFGVKVVKISLCSFKTWPWILHFTKTACTKPWLDEQTLCNLFSIISTSGHKTDYLVVQANSSKNNQMNKLCVKWSYYMGELMISPGY
jgi:hypothetical protein